MITTHFGCDTISETLIAMQMVVIIPSNYSYFLHFLWVSQWVTFPGHLPEIQALCAASASAFSMMLSFTSSSVFTEPRVTWKGSLNDSLLPLCWQYMCLWGIDLKLSGLMWEAPAHHGQHHSLQGVSWTVWEGRDWAGHRQADKWARHIHFSLLLTLDMLG